MGEEERRLAKRTVARRENVQGGLRRWVGSSVGGAPGLRCSSLILRWRTTRQAAPCPFLFAHRSLVSRNLPGSTIQIHIVEEKRDQNSFLSRQLSSRARLPNPVNQCLFGCGFHVTDLACKASPAASIAQLAIKPSIVKSISCLNLTPRLQLSWTAPLEMMTRTKMPSSPR